MNELFSMIATWIAYQAGRPVSFLLAVLIILVWAIMGPIFHFSDTWQLIINTGTTIVTFLMVFVIQNTQNRDGAAIQAKRMSSSDLPVRRIGSSASSILPMKR